MCPYRGLKSARISVMLCTVSGLVFPRYLAWSCGERIGSSRMPELTELPEPARQRALERYRTLQPHFEQNVPLAQVARTAGLPDRTARRYSVKTFLCHFSNSTF